MPTITTSTVQFPEALVPEVFKKVSGHSSIAKLSAAAPIRFAGNEQFVFTMDGEVSVVGEGAQKPAGEAAFKPVTITPIKMVYQHRLTDEFVHMAEEAQVPYLEAFMEGFATKMARGVDIVAFHGINPADKTAVAALASKNFDSAVTSTITYAAATCDDNLDAAVQAITATDGQVTGIAMTPAFGSAMAGIKVNGVVQYPEFRFGRNPDSFYGMSVDVNPTVNFGASDSDAAKDMAIVGDFRRALRWGYAERIPMEIIQYGDPDGQGDLKRNNQIVLRAEAYVGWGILDPGSFVRIVAA